MYGRELHIDIKLDGVKSPDELLVYPNPLEPSQQLNIEFLSKRESEQIIMIDMLGRIMKRITVTTIG